jgi:hypothetical protein
LNQFQLLNSKSARNFFKVRLATWRTDRASLEYQIHVSLRLISASLEAGPKINILPSEHREGISKARTSTESGIKTSPDTLGGRSNNSLRCDWDENAKVNSEPHLVKQSSPILLSEEGMRIDFNDEQFENARA